MTSQNFVDFIYSTLSTLQSNDWPQGGAPGVVNIWWTPIAIWIAQDGVIPFLNLQDYLRWYQPSAAPVVSCPAVSAVGFCNALMTACEQLPAAEATNPWGQAACLAAATCAGYGTLVRNRLTCLGFNVPALLNMIIDYNLYASIVGSCAWAPGGCPITPQNYIDFIYRTLVSIQSSAFPIGAQDLVDTYFSPIVSWIAQTDAPYANFLDWLRWKT